MQPYAQRWIFSAVIYFCVAVSLGVYMGASNGHSLHTVHAHLNLLGWVSQSLIGIIYHFFPRAGASRAATVQFWIHNTVLPVMMIALGFLLKGNTGVEPVMGITSVIMLGSIVTFAVNILGRRA